MATVPRVEAVLFDGIRSFLDIGTLNDSLYYHKEEAGLYGLKMECLADWSSEYKHLVNGVNSWRGEWEPPEVLHLRSLKRALGERVLQRFVEEEIEYMAQADAWRYVEPLPGVRDAVIKLTKDYVVAPFVTAGHKLIEAASQGARLPWNHVPVTPERCGAYKPHPQAYIGAAALLGLRPSEIAVVGTSNESLAVAQEEGFMTVFWPGVDPKPTGQWDMVCTSVADFANKMILDTSLWLPERAA